MDDKKTKNASKRINIKNKKVATKVLSKTNNNKTKKSSPKKPQKDEKKEIKQEIKQEIKKEDKQKVQKKKIVKEEKAKKIVKKKPTKQEIEKNKLLIPKQWQNIKTNSKVTKIKNSNDNKLGGLKGSIFEEIDENAYQINKKKNRENLKKTAIISIIIIALIATIIIVLLKYNNDITEKLKKYDIFSIGDKVTLQDGSLWYVVADSKDTESTVKIISDTILDLDKNDVKDSKDRKKYHEQGLDIYDVKDENSVAYFLNNDYKQEEEEKVGKIEEVNLLTSKEYVKIRERMGFGYEWSEGNWLANKDLNSWWIISSQNEKVYVVTYKGTYKLTKPGSVNFIRPVITIKKEQITKLSEQEESNLLRNIDELLKNKNKD